MILPNDSIDRAQGDPTRQTVSDDESVERIARPVQMDCFHNQGLQRNFVQDKPDVPGQLRYEADDVESDLADFCEKLQLQYRDR